MSQEKLQRPGQFVLDVCTLNTSGNAVIDLVGGANVMHITFFEDMLTPYVQGSIVIQNQGAASNIGPIIGQETLELVNIFIDNVITDTRPHATLLGRALWTAGFIHLVHDDHQFSDRGFFYRFYHILL